LLIAMFIGYRLSYLRTHGVVRSCINV